MKKTIIITLLAIYGSAIGQDIHFPIVLTQRLPWAPATINVGSTCAIDVIIDTIDYVDIVTSGTAEQLDTMSFPSGKITLDEATKRLTIDNSISIKNGISRFRLFNKL